MGFPALSPEDLCLFSGRVSCFLENQRAYLVDGVAVNGVSGGPAFHLGLEGSTTLIGVVSAYIPNLAAGRSLPGLCLVRDVKQLHDVVAALKSMEEAKRGETPQGDVQEDIVQAESDNGDTV